ncbi:MAG: stage V sporulation protein AD, partial [Lachnospiraceae bacterium]|nr:stage V sporulation protein AD [Lachnospiraceae bacterium]
TESGFSSFISRQTDANNACGSWSLSAYILKQIEEQVWKKVLFIPTGALLSKTSFNEGKSVPGIAHAVVIEGCK